jgi:hypothetical protein
VSASSTGRAGRGRVVAVSAALVVLPLTACSVPREADLASGGSAVAASPSPSLSLSVSVPPSQTPSPSASPSPIPSPAPAPVKPPRPKAVKGYTLGAAPRSVPNPLAGVKGANEVFGATTVRSVSTNGKPVGLVFLFAVRPEYLNDPQVIGPVVTRLTNSISRSGVPLKEQTWGGRPVRVGSSAKNGTIALWYRGGVLTVVVGGADPGVVTSYAKALLAVS